MAHQLAPDFQSTCEDNSETWLQQSYSVVKVKIGLLNKITCDTEETSNPREGGELIIRITGLKIGWYTDFQKGAKLTYLEDPNEDRNFTELLPVMSASDCIFMHWIVLPIPELWGSQGMQMLR